MKAILTKKQRVRPGDLVTFDLRSRRKLGIILNVSEESQLRPGAWKLATVIIFVGGLIHETAKVSVKRIA